MTRPHSRYPHTTMPVRAAERARRPAAGPGGRRPRPAGHVAASAGSAGGARGRAVARAGGGAEEAARQAAGLVGRLGRVLAEKAKADVGKVFDGTSRTREKLAVVDEVRPDPTRFPRAAPSGR